MKERMEGKIELYLEGISFEWVDNSPNSRRYKCRALNTERFSPSPGLLTDFGIMCSVVNSSTIEIRKLENVEWEEVEPVIRFVLSIILFLYLAWKNRLFDDYTYLKFNKYEEAISFFLKTFEYQEIEKVFTLEKEGSLRLLKPACYTKPNTLSKDVLQEMKEFFEAIQKQPLEDLARNTKILLEAPNLYTETLLIQDQNEKDFKINALSESLRQVDMRVLLDRIRALHKIVDENYSFLRFYRSSFDPNAYLNSLFDETTIELEENLKLQGSNSQEGLSLKSLQRFAEIIEYERLSDKKDLKKTIDIMNFAIENTAIIKMFWDLKFDSLSLNELYLLQKDILPLCKEICKPT